MTRLLNGVRKIPNAMSEEIDPLREYMRVARMIAICKSRLLLLETKIEKSIGARRTVATNRARATEAEIEFLLDEGDRHLGDLRERWQRLRTHD